MKYIHIKVDGSFSDGMEQVVDLLNDGWCLFDKSITDGRYIHYILSESSDPDVGRCSPNPEG